MCNLKELDFQMAMDLKCTNIVFGLQSSEARHPCPYYTSFRREDTLWVARAMKTIDSIVKCHESWLQETCGNKTILKNCIMQ